MAMSAPIVPAPITCTRKGATPSLGACAFIASINRKTRRRFFEVSDSSSGANAFVSARFNRAIEPPFCSKCSINAKGAG